MSALPKVASSFATDCKKCGFERMHRVLTHPTATSAKVECEICKTKSTYKLDQGGKVAKKPSTKKPKKDAATIANEAFLKLKEKLGGSKAKPYRMADAYSVDMVIEHPKFGTGFVVTSLGEKIEVAFEDANRALVQNRK
jgi:hypothetical protein